ncbi:MAG: gamma-glutamylcyclotransferase [Ectothiorhodospiraceae bacterium]|nr:gamma-glutamylcyclotransferase [Ectothiorhodospiraceae bacterium]
MDLYYFAYGSNLARARLEARVGAVGRVGTGRLDGHALRFHKRGRDGSGKCDVAASAAPGDHVLGAVYTLTFAQRRRLDLYEGPDYAVRRLPVRVGDGRPVEAFTYLAFPRAVDPRLTPFDWYRDFVLHGALENDFPAAYVAFIEACPVVADPDARRALDNRRILGRV